MFPVNVFPPPVTVVTVVEEVPVNAIPALEPAVEIVLTNPENTRGSVNFVLGEVAYRLEPGAAQRLKLSAPALVEFDRGGSFGRARYTLAGGKYSFCVTEKGWDLYNQSAAAASRIAPEPLSPLAEGE